MGGVYTPRINTFVCTAITYARTRTSPPTHKESEREEWTNTQKKTVKKARGPKIDTTVRSYTIRPTALLAITCGTHV